MRISDWSSDVCSSDLDPPVAEPAHRARAPVRRRFAAPVAFDHAGFPREAFHPDPGVAPAAAARADQKGALGPEVAEHQVGPGGGNCRKDTDRAAPALSHPVVDRFLGRGWSLAILPAFGIYGVCAHTANAGLDR